MIAETLESLLGSVTYDASIAIPASRSRFAVAAKRALIEHGLHDLHLIAVPTSGIQADMLIGAGYVCDDGKCRGDTRRTGSGTAFRQGGQGRHH